MRKWLLYIALPIISLSWVGCGGGGLESGIPEGATAGKAPDLPGMEVSIKDIQKKGNAAPSGPGNP